MMVKEKMLSKTVNVFSSSFDNWYVTKHVLIGMLWENSVLWQPIQHNLIDGQGLKNVSERKSYVM